MNKEFQPRKYIRRGKYLIPIIYLILIIGMVILNLRMYFLIDMTLLLIAIGILTWHLYYQMAGVVVIIEDDYLLYKHRGGEKRFDFDKITKIRLPFIPSFGGWVIIISGKEKIRLSAYLENFGGFIQTLKESLDRKGLENLYEESKFLSLFKEAVHVDQSWERVCAFLIKLLLVSIASGLFGFLGIGIDLISFSGVFWGLFFILYPSIVYAVTEFVYAKRIARTINRETFFVPPRDIAFENKVYRIAGVIGVVVYLIIVLVMFL